MNEDRDGYLASSCLIDLALVMCTRRTEAILVIAEELRRVHGPESYSAVRCRILNLGAANIKIVVGVEPSSARSEAHFGSFRIPAQLWHALAKCSRTITRIFQR